MRTRWRSQSGGRRMKHGDVDVVEPQVVAGHDVRPRKPAVGAAACNTCSGSKRGNGNPLPDLTRTKLLDDRRGAADVVGIAVGQHEVVETADARVAQHGRDDAIADVERRAPARPPASTSNVVPCGNRMNAESPWPTSRNATCIWPSPRDVSQLHGSASIHERCRHRSTIDCEADDALRHQCHERDVIERRRPTTMAARRETRRRRESHELGRSHEPSAPRCATKPAASASCPGQQRQRHDRHPGDLRDRHQRNREKVERQAGECHARKEHRAGRKQQPPRSPPTR